MELSKKVLAITVIIIGTLTMSNDVFAQRSENQNGFLVHVSSGDSQFKIIKALRFADNMNKKGNDILLYFDADATYLTLEETEDFVFNNHSYKTLLRNLASSEVDVRVCKGNLKNGLKKSEKDLISGIEVGDPEMFFSFTDGKIVTLDY